MPKNKLDDLRNHLFEVIEMLKDGDISVENAKAIKGVGDTIINSAKVELQFINITKNTQIKSNFISAPEADNQPKQLTTDEIADCKCGDAIYPSDAEKSSFLGLDYPRCRTCLAMLPVNLDHTKANGAAHISSN